MQHSLSGSLYLLNCQLTFALFLTPDRKMQPRVGCSQTHSDHIFVTRSFPVRHLEEQLLKNSQLLLSQKKSIFLPSEETEALQISKEALLYWLPKLTVHRLQAESLQRDSAVSPHHLKCLAASGCLLFSTMINVWSNSIRAF